MVALHEIRNSKQLMDKLGVKSDSQVAVLAVEDGSFWRELKERTPYISKIARKKDFDFILVLTERIEDLKRLDVLRKHIKRNGAIWVVFPKGRRHIRGTDVINAAKQKGLVDIKVVSFSRTHTALKLVIPVVLR